ncbi:MAG: hypothetical protein QM780_01695 [Hyphomicrobium sp.]|uniref:hypothetical protein n=1 Tax=Hyphomicrobium sp. TaxID=82 RepID=UPI0039E28979
MTGSFALDGTDYEWEFRREPRWRTGYGLQGHQVAVRAVKAGGREALLQFPIPKKVALLRRDYRHRPQVHQAEVEAAVRLALATGWDPFARGKPFHVDVT